jgi:uncharacterized membrane protein YvlD (DUF360 family)
MLWMVSAMLLVLWLAGMVGEVGPWVHVFLVAAILAVVAALIRPSRLDSI